MGTHEEAMKYLASANWKQTDLALVQWRCENEAHYRDIIALLRSRRIFSPVVWNYAVKHGDVPALKELLASDRSVQRLASTLLSFATFKSPLLTLAGEVGVGATSDAVADAEPPVALDGDATRFYEHLEYSPLINARAHVLGTTRKIVNEAVARQWRSVLSLVASKRAAEVSAADRLAVVYHLLLQDRVAEAVAMFAKVPAPADSAATSRTAGAPAATAVTPTPTANWLTLQYDYLAAYMDFFHWDPVAATGAGVGAGAGAGAAMPAPYALPIASAVARAYAGYPVPKWAAKFAEIGTQVMEALAAAAPASRTAATAALGSGVSAEETGTSKELSREAQQAKAASKEPSLELAIEGDTVVLTYANVSSVLLRFYCMDVELLFSTSPFLTKSAGGGGGGKSDSLGQFAYVRPNGVLVVPLPAAAVGKTAEHRVALPPAFAKTNVMVEATSPQAGIRRAVPYFSNRMSIAVTEAFGRLKVTHSETGAPIPRAYVKVFYRTSEGDKGRFYKDGYTDLRGVYDYTAISTDELGKTQRFALLVVSDADGSAIKEASPPRS